MIGGTRFSTRNFFFAMAIPLHPAHNSSSPVVPFFDALAAENGFALAAENGFAGVC
jgi:hypothetical protein